jgi:retron-type reverse transcriptase
LEQNLQSLIDRLKSGRYRAPPVRRHYIDKSDGSKRALGIPTVRANYPGIQRVVGMG